MTERETFDDIVHFRRPARTPVFDLEGVAEQTFRLWIQQGHVPLGAERQGWLPCDGRHANLRFDPTDPRRKFGADPLDVEAMMDVTFPKNYVPETDYDAASPDRTRHSRRPGRGL